MRALLKWKAVVSIYVLIFFVGLGIIEGRGRAAGLHPTWVDRAPLLVASYNWFFRPERMHYVAAIDLKSNHKIEPTDITQLDLAMSNYLPARSTVLGKYLKKEVRAGQAILPKSLADAPTLPPDSDKWMVTLRVNADSKLEKTLQPDSTVSLLLPPNEKLEGKIVTSSRDIPPAKKTAGTENKQSKSAATEPSPSPSASPE